MGRNPGTYIILDVNDKLVVQSDDAEHQLLHCLKDIYLPSDETYKGYYKTDERGFLTIKIDAPHGFAEYSYDCFELMYDPANHNS